MAAWMVARAASMAGLTPPFGLLLVVPTGEREDELGTRYGTRPTNQAQDCIRIHPIGVPDGWEDGVCNFLPCEKDNKANEEAGR